MKKSHFIFAVGAIVLLLATGCQAPGSTSADQAAVNMIYENPGAGAAVDPSSIQVLQTQLVDGSTYVFLAYQRMWNNRNEKCLGMYETHYQLLLGWSAGSGGGICMERENGDINTNEPLHFSSGTINRSDQKKPDISYVTGWVNDPQVDHVRVTWEDGQAQEEAVVNGSFIAIRTGRVGIKNTESLMPGMQ